MNRNPWIWLGTTLGAAGVVGALIYSRRAKAASPQDMPTRPTGEPAPIEPMPLPRAEEVQGDLTTNWGTTPVDLRPLFMLIEEVARIPGCGRVLSVFSYRESRYVTTAHNGDADDEEEERKRTREAYNNNKDRNPPLRWGDEAAEFGSGGLFGLAAPYFLWSGVPEVGEEAPLLDAPPELLFQPRASAFGASVYLQRLLKHYRIDDIPDIRAGWASPSLLKSGRGGQRYQETRARFLSDAKTVGIDLSDASTIPPVLDPSGWPGVPAVFAGLVGALSRTVA